MNRVAAALFKLALIAIIVRLIMINAHAVEPAPRVGEDYAPNLGSFYSSLYNIKGEWCCNASDVRPTEIRIVDGHFEAWIDRRYPEVAVGTSPAGWYPIPTDAAVPDRENPIGEPIVGFFHGVVRCFLDTARG